jgi:hypothetical protein
MTVLAVMNNIEPIRLARLKEDDAVLEKGQGQ